MYVVDVLQFFIFLVDNFMLIEDLKYTLSKWCQTLTTVYFAVVKVCI